MSPTRRAVLSLGSNLGDRLGHLRKALGALTMARDVRLVDVSPVYETAPVGGPEQPDYLNLVVRVDTELTPRELLTVAHWCEQRAGRERTVRFGPRTLDVDLITIDDLALDSDALTLPHPRAHERAFVLAPWLDLDPAAELPGRGRAADLLAVLDSSGVCRYADPPEPET